VIQKISKLNAKSESFHSLLRVKIATTRSMKGGR